MSRNIAKVSETGRGVSGLVKVEQAAKERLDKIFGKNLTEGKKMTLIDEETGNIVK